MMAGAGASTGWAVGAPNQSFQAEVARPLGIRLFDRVPLPANQAER